jgi:hypothetical protein
MSNALNDQIGLQQQDSHTYAAGYDAEWTVGPSTLHTNYLYRANLHYAHWIL